MDCLSIQFHIKLIREKIEFESITPLKNNLSLYYTLLVYLGSVLSLFLLTMTLCMKIRAVKVLFYLHLCGYE
ncbi:hypothetical protein PPL_03810 [Heterostelium album PN500]|uniref:Uncharacterized protein n=1 Tax=Heterostelium pallidum (strain ATCC 26659 / Pp 5 / PN500) TaxID=670386 RepID=D3B6Q6_HETP5|nr:hypothetical protein PPL_03810 [Heterostelium album PN500]EFA83026.1 hypothetical protein PPL_03810 [Heterostelium album PN500]|eukprot:XP_020435143.1 hypothetical protein PPL_03810 [Heterostelium album PN500]